MAEMLKQDNVEGEFFEFSSKEETGQVLAKDVADILGEAIQQRGSASLIVSGGSTPMPFFKALASYGLDWKKVSISVADERWVLPSDKDSSEKLVRDNLFKGRASEARFISLGLPADNPDMSVHEGAAFATKSLNKIANATTPFDVVILGMGEDGHTASLFPDHETLDDALGAKEVPLCIAVENSPKPPSQRITMSYKTLTNTRNLMLHFTGKAKKEIYDSAFASDVSVNSLPIKAFLEQNDIPVNIYWTAE